MRQNFQTYRHLHKLRQTAGLHTLHRRLSIVFNRSRTNWLEHGVRYFYVHSDPFPRVGLANVRKMLGR